MENQPTKTVTQASEVQQPVIQKKNNTTRNVIIIVLVLLLCCCLSCVVLAIAAPNALFRIATSSGNRPSVEESTTVTPQEINETNSNIEELLNTKKEEAMNESSGDTYTVSLTEKEILSSSLKDAEGLDPSAVGLNIEPGVANIVIDIGKALEAVKDNPQAQEGLNNLPFDASMLQGIVLTAQISATADGKSINIDSISTGNPIIDSLIPKDITGGLQNQIDPSEWSQEGFNGEQIEKIEFLKDQIRLTFKK